MNCSSPKSSLAKLGFNSNKQKPIRLMVLGQTGVGKTAMVVRFITKRFIEDYDPNLERIYTHSSVIENDTISFEILDAAGQLSEENLTLETNIRWADVFILVYSITDKCSFDECNRLKFLINHNKRRRKLSNNKEGFNEVPVILVGNKTDQFNDRMITTKDGQQLSKEISCACFHEISVRESIDQVLSVFRDAYFFWRINKYPKLKRSSSDTYDLKNGLESMSSSENVHYYCCDCKLQKSWKHSWIDETKDHDGKELHQCFTKHLDSCKCKLGAFRNRASTDGNLEHRHFKWRCLIPAPRPLTSQQSCSERRMSISMRGNDGEY